MKIKIAYLLFTLVLLTNLRVNAQEIPIEYLTMQLPPGAQQYTKNLLENEIKGIQIEHVALTGETSKKEMLQKGYKAVYLFMKGLGKASAGGKEYAVVPESILLPNAVRRITIQSGTGDTLHYLRISVKLTEQDIHDLEDFPEENTRNTYFARFIDCEAYTEAIKSPTTVSRTVLPNAYIPRVAMGTVETAGPDKVAPHEHPMLEQLFLGLSGNQVIVHADDKQVDFPAYSVLHIPLGSSHWVEAGEGEKMYYMWMDFFMDRKGEEWLKTHEKIDEE